MAKPHLELLKDNNMASLREQAVALRERVRADLWGRTLPFWMRHSIDNEHGGFFNCLDEDGSVTDSTKHIWLQGRQCWMLARLAALYSAEQIDAMTAQYKHEFPDDAVDGSGSDGSGLVGAVPGMPRPPRVAVTRANLIAAAERGVDFLRRHAVQRAPGTGEIECVYFAVARDGTPVLHQRKIFSATFLIMALGEVGRVTGRAELRQEAVALLDRVFAWIDRPGALGKPALPGAPPLEPLNVPMIMLNVIDELAAGIADETERREFYAERRAWCVFACFCCYFLFCIYVLSVVEIPFP